VRFFRPQADGVLALSLSKKLLDAAGLHVGHKADVDVEKVQPPWRRPQAGGLVDGSQTMAEVKRIHYAWVVAAVTFIALMGAAGFRATPSVLIVPLQHEFGWNRAVISLAVSINLILFGLTGPFAAALMDRFGLRVVAVAALITVATGALLTTLMNAPWQLYLLWGVVVGLGTGSMASVLAATVASRWFVRRRGLVLGALTGLGRRASSSFCPGSGGWRRTSAGAKPRSRWRSQPWPSCRSSAC